MEVAETVEHVRAAAEGVDGIAAVYLFGSVAAERAGADSDVDVGVLYDVTPPSTLSAGSLDLEADLERRLGRPVQVVVLNTAPADLGIRVLRAQRLVVDLLQTSGWIDVELRDALARMAGFRNILVHGYDDVDLAIVRDVVEHRLADLERYVAAIRAGLCARR